MSNKVLNLYKIPVTSSSNKFTYGWSGRATRLRRTSSANLDNGTAWPIVIAALRCATGVLWIVLVSSTLFVSFHSPSLYEVALRTEVLSRRAVKP